MSETDAHWMKRALALAQAQSGRTSPNPAVGCVLVLDAMSQASGATGDGGRPHAEEIALASAGRTARGATAYVTLEPCGARSLGGPSCAERLIDAGVRRVVIACADPSPFASGQGMEQLTAAGVQVDLGLLSDAVLPLYRSWFAQH